MKVLIAPQSFKGGLSGHSAAEAIKAGVLSLFPEAQTRVLPIADGGDGTLDALIGNTSGKIFTTQVTGPLGNPVSATWGVMGDGVTAVIEMARASGLTLVPIPKRDPQITTTSGTGELIQEALSWGYKRIIIGLGGSATNDGGVGMAEILGVRFLDQRGNDIPQGGIALKQLSSIDVTRINPAIQSAEIIAATDVTNPLCGPEGASVVYGPQKGATPEVVRKLDEALTHYAKIVETNLGVDIKSYPGAGAAGGLGAGLIIFANAQILSGIDLICDTLDFNSQLEDVDLIITGEGAVDSSTAYNKAPVGIARRAKARGIPVLLLAGSLGEGYEAVYDHGINAVVCIADRPMSMRDSLIRSHELLANAVNRSLRLLGLTATQ